MFSKRIEDKGYSLASYLQSHWIRSVESDGSQKCHATAPSNRACDSILFMSILFGLMPYARAGFNSGVGRLSVAAVRVL